MRSLFIAGVLTALSLIAANTAFGQAAPGITTQPASQTALQGSNVVFSVVASGQATLIYQWSKGGANLSDSGHIVGSTTSALTILSALAGDAASYRVVVTNRHGSATSSDATLAVLVPPTVTQQPSSITIGIGSNATFNVEWGGTQPITNTWFFNGLPLTAGARIVISNQVSASGSLIGSLSITSIQTVDAGTYSAVASNVAGSATSSAATLTTIAFPPAITAQPQSQTVVDGTPVSFSVGVSGTLPISYQWYRDFTQLGDDKFISGATTPTLSLSTPSIGSYYLVASNAFGSTNSLAAILTVLFAPSITMPYNEIVGVGTNAILRTTVSGTHPLTNVWFFNGSPVVSGGRYLTVENISDVVDAYLVISNAQTADLGSYWVVSSNVVGSATSSAWSLNLGYPPAMIDQPQSQTITTNGWTTLSVNASGTDPITYQWYEGTARLSDTSQFIGTQTAALTITNANVSNISSYSVVLTNAFGQTTSAVATVTVVSVPEVLTANSLTAVVGSSPKLGGYITSLTAVTNQWFFNGAPIVTNDHFVTAERMVGSQLESLLTISNAQVSDSGNYWLVSSNLAGGTVSSNITLVVGYPPEITQQPLTQAVTNGFPFTLTVGATGSDPLGYQWYWGIASIGEGGHYVGMQTASLTVTNPLSSDAGSYSVVVTNAFGSVTSSNSVVTVLIRPSVAILGRSVPLGWPTVFAGSASGTTPLSYQWQLNGADISGATNLSYSIASITANDLGTYNLVVSNVAGVTVSSNALLTVGPVVGFGDNSYNQCLPPAGLSNVVSVAGGWGSFAVTVDGAVVKWGNTPGTPSIPADYTNIVGLAVAPNYAVNTGDAGIALRADGTVAGFGKSIPTTWSNIVAVACNSSYRYGLRSDGIVLGTEQLMPTGLNNIVAISAADTQVMALRNDGTVVVWSLSTSSATNVPPGLSNVVAISSGYSICLAAKADGTAVAWGRTGSTNLPNGLSNVVAVAASQFSGVTSRTTYCTALRTNGNVGFWGGSFFSTNLVSSASNAVAIAAGYFNGLALINDGSPQLVRLPVGGTAYSGRDLVLKAQAVGAPVITYQWLHDGNVVTDATNATLTLTNIQLTDAGHYQVVVTNALGSVTSVTAPVKVINSAPWFVQQPTNRTVVLASSVNLGGMPVNGSGPLSYTWRFSNIKGSLTNIVTTSTDLVLNPVQVSDMGTYWLVVSNGFGVATSQTINLTVRQVAAWGDNTYSKTNVPTTLTNAIAICGGNNYNCVALRDNGTPQQWGYSGTSSPANITNLCEVAVANGTSGFYGLRTDGKPVGWGNLPLAVVNAISNIVSIEADDGGSTYLRTNGTFLRLDNGGNVISLSAAINTNVVAISRLNGDIGFMALRADGTFYTSGASLPTGPTNVVSVAGSFLDGVALKRDGTVQSWGFTNAPLSNIVAVTATASQMQFAVRADGTITNWGRTGIQASNVPPLIVRPWSLDGGYDNVVALFTTNAFPPVPLYTALDTSALVVSSRSSPQWFGQTNFTHDGLHAARSAALGNNTASSMRMLATNGAIKVSFWWKVSSATNHGMLTFAIGGVPQASISGEVDWQQVTFTVPASPQMLVWTYSKDSAAGAGQDAGFVDQLTFTPIPAAITLQPVSQTVVGGTTALFTASATGTPPLSYRWYNLTNGTPIGTAPGLFRFVPASRSSSGTYYLIVTNAFGSDRSTNFTLTVHVPQRIGLPLLQSDGTFLLTSQDVDQTLFPSGTDASGFQAQFSSNLIDWLPVNATLSISNGVMQLNDTDATNAMQRFYRIIEGW